MSVRVIERGSEILVCDGEKVLGSFYDREEAELYAEVLNAELSWKRVKKSIVRSLEEYVGACELITCRIEFPYILVSMFLKGLELNERIPLKKGTLENEERIVKFIISFISRRLGVYIKPIIVQEEDEEEKGDQEFDQKTLW